jgi:hypothetical protein
MSLPFEMSEPVIETSYRLADRLYCASRDRFKPLGHPVPLAFNQPAFLVALVGSVREQQRDQIPHAFDFANTPSLRAILEQPDLLHALLKTVVRRAELLRKHVPERVVVRVWAIDRCRQVIDLVSI